MRSNSAVPAYFDYAASCPVDPRVFAVAREAEDLVGNPSSLHGFGRAIRAVVDRARADVERLFGEGDVVFTSGGTEAAALAIRAAFLQARVGVIAPRILVSALEHASVRDAVAAMAAEYGAVVEVLPAVGGVVSGADASDMIRPETVLVCVMRANNILGTLQPVAAVGDAVKAERLRRGASGAPIVFLCDAVQAAATTDLRDVSRHADLIAISGHKMYASKGVGALWARKGSVSISRSGTENVSGIAGMGEAARILAAGRGVEEMLSLQSDVQRLLGTYGLRVLAEQASRVPNVLYAVHEKMRGDELALRLDAEGVAVSVGSACDAGTKKASPVLESAFGNAVASRGGVRISFGRFTTARDVDSLASALAAVFGRRL